MKKVSSISNVVNLVIVLITTAVILFFGAYNYHVIRQSELQSLNRDAEVITTGIARNIAFPLYNLDYPVVQDIINNAMASQAIEAIVLLGENGKELVYGIRRNADWQRVQLTDLEEWKKGEGILKEVEVIHASTVLGRLNVHYTKRFLNDKLRRHLFQTLVQVLMIVTLLTVLNILLLRKLLIQPIKSLQSFAEAIKSGNLDARVGEATFIGELASLRTSLKEMADELLYALIKQIPQAGIQVKTSATEIFASARDIEGAIAGQATSTRQAAATSNSIAVRSRKLAETMDDVMQVTRETTELAEQGQGSLQKMGLTMHSLMDATGAISSKLSTIDQKANNISNIVVTINKVAEQTNLLSLNAAVEAEKAGEFGRGFSVVAREIRRLSDQTEVALLKIARMVEEMQSAVSSGVMEMDKFVMRVNQGVQEMGEINSRFINIIDQVRALFPRYEEVNEAMQAQSSGADEISKVLEQLNQVSEETRESLHEFTKAASHLTQAVQSLQAEVARFKINNPVT